MSNPPDKTDADLLKEFSEEGNHAAFAALVGRHGPMVHGVSLRVMSNHHDAEDVTQAVFIVLAREAARLHRETSVAGWLHTVSRRLSLNAIKARASRHQREQAAMIETNEPAPDAVEAAAFRRELDEALGSLPDHYRQPLVLFHLQGASLHEAGSRLGLNPNTLRIRLSRGRDLLREALRRRGVTTTSVAAMGALLAGQATAAPLSPAFASGVLSTAIGGAAVSPQVLLLAQQAVVPSAATGALTTVTFILMKAKVITAAVVLVTGAAVYLIQQQKSGSAQPAAEPNIVRTESPRTAPGPPAPTVSTSRSSVEGPTQEQLREEARRQFKQAMKVASALTTESMATTQRATYEDRIRKMAEELSLTDAQKSRLQLWLEDRLSQIRILDLDDKTAVSNLLESLNFMKLEEQLASDLTPGQKTALAEFRTRETQKKVKAMALKDLSLLQAAIDFEGVQYEIAYTLLAEKAEKKVSQQDGQPELETLLKGGANENDDEFGLGIQKAMKALQTTSPGEKIDLRKVIDERIAEKTEHFRNLLNEKQLEQFSRYLKTKTEEAYGPMLNLLEGKEDGE